VPLFVFFSQYLGFFLTHFQIFSLLFLFHALCNVFFFLLLVWLIISSWFITLFINSIFYSIGVLKACKFYFIYHFSHLQLSYW
jgi:hypothetical protein